MSKLIGEYERSESVNLNEMRNQLSVEYQEKLSDAIDFIDKYSHMNERWQDENEYKMKEAILTIRNGLVDFRQFRLLFGYLDREGKLED